MNDPRPDPDADAGDGDALEQRQAESLARVERGGIPLDAERRLSQLAGAPRQDGVAGARSPPICRSRTSRYAIS